MYKKQVNKPITNYIASSRNSTPTQSNPSHQRQPSPKNTSNNYPTLPIISNQTIYFESMSYSRVSDTDKKYQKNTIKPYYKSLSELPQQSFLPMNNSLQLSGSRVKKLMQIQGGSKYNKQLQNRIDLQKRLCIQMQERKRDRKQLEQRMQQAQVKIIKHCNDLYSKNLREITQLLSIESKKRREQQRQDGQILSKIWYEKRQGEDRKRIEDIQKDIKDLKQRCSGEEIEKDKKVYEQMNGRIRELLEQLNNELNKQNELQLIIHKKIDKIEQKIINQYKQIQNRIEQWQDKIQNQLSNLNTNSQTHTLKTSFLKLQPIILQIQTNQKNIQKQFQHILDQLSVHHNKINLFNILINQYKSNNLNIFKQFKQSTIYQLQSYHKTLLQKQTQMHKTIKQTQLWQKQTQQILQKLLFQINKSKDNNHDSLSISKSYKPQLMQNSVNSNFEFDKFMGQISKQSSGMYISEIRRSKNIIQENKQQEQYDELLGIPILKQTNEQMDMQLSKPPNLLNDVKNNNLSPDLQFGDIMMKSHSCDMQDSMK